MLRFLQLIFHNPLAIFKIIYYWFRIATDKLKGKKSIVYNLHYDYFFDIFYSIYVELKKRKNLKIYFSYLHNNLSLKKYLLDNCDKQQLISNKISPFLPFSLFICAEITGPDFPLNLLKTRKLQIYHGNGISGFHNKIKVLKRFDAHFALGPNFNYFFQSVFSGSYMPNIYKVGYPKLDLLLQKSTLTEKLSKLYHLKKRPTILYTPHWNPFGSLHYFQTKLIDQLLKYDFNILIKPHHYLYVKYPNLHWKNRFLSYEQKYEKVTLVTRPNTQELYPLADLMISDTGSSAPFEYSLLLKPLFVFANQAWLLKNSDEYNSEEIAILEAAICFENLAEFKTLIEKFNKHDALFKTMLKKQRAKQSRLVNSLLYNPGKATPKAIEAIEKELAKC